MILTLKYLIATGSTNSASFRQIVQSPKEWVDDLLDVSESFQVDAELLSNTNRSSEKLALSSCTVAYDFWESDIE